MRFGAVWVAILALFLAMPIEASAYSIRRTPIQIQAYTQKAMRGDVGAMVVLGDAYNYGLTKSGKIDVKKALYWYLKAANAGSVEAELRLGELYSSNEKLPKDDKQAFFWFSLAAKKGNYNAQYLLAQLIQTSSVIEKDYTAAYHWMLKSARQGHESAIERLDIVYAYGDAVSDYDEVLKKIQAAAEAGDSESQWRMGWLCQGGILVPEDHIKALEWLRKSALQDNPKGLTLLAVLTYGDDITTPPPKSEIIAWLQRAADQGYVPAQDFLTRILDDNLELKSEAEKQAYELRILEWLKQAAEKGYPQSQNRLASYYLEGIYVGKDGAEAYKWYKLSRRLPSQNDEWYYRIFEAEALPDNIKNEGNRRAEQWLIAHPKLWWEKP